MTELAREFNESGRRGRRRVRLRPPAAARRPAPPPRPWPGAGTSRSTVRRRSIWSPGGQHVGRGGQPAARRPGRGADRAARASPFMLTPLVIAMPQPMAEALGWPGHADRVDRHPEPGPQRRGLGRVRPPGVGRVQAGQDQPQLLDQRPQRARRPVRTRPPARRRGCRPRTWPGPTSIDFATTVESAVVHYGDTTLTFLNNWYRADQRDTALTYVSAAAVEEKSVIDYNSGNPDGVLDPGEEPRPPQVPLVAIYPTEGTLFSDNPLMEINADWVTPEQHRGRRAVRRLRPAGRRARSGCSSSASARATPTWPSPTRSRRTNGVDPDQPQTLLEVPEPSVMIELLDRWDEQRKRGRVHARDRRVRARWASQSGGGADPARPGQGGGDRRARPVRGRRRGGAADLLDRPQRGPSPTSTSTWPLCARRRPGRGLTQRHRRASSRPTAPRSTRSRQVSYDDALARLRPGQDQRRRAAHRRPERRRQPRRRRPAARRAAQRPRGRAPRARRRARCGSSPSATAPDADQGSLRAHRRGQRRRRLRRQRPDVDRPGAHRR